MHPFQSKITINLKDCRFFARHGVFPRERIAGNEFKVSVSLTYTPSNIQDDNLDSTISYADLYEIVKREMEIPRNLLESVAASIATEACKQWQQISRINVSITKIAPPVSGMIGEASVEYELYK